MDQSMSAGRCRCGLAEAEEVPASFRHLVSPLRPSPSPDPDLLQSLDNLCRNRESTALAQQVDQWAAVLHIPQTCRKSTAEAFRGATWS
jgi:hypothetical protein